MEDEEADKTSSSNCSCENEDRLRSAKYEESVITSDDDLGDDIEIIERRRNFKNDDNVSTLSNTSADRLAISYTVDDNSATNYTIDTSSRPTTSSNTRLNSFSSSLINMSGEKNVRSTLPYPSNLLGSYKVRSQVMHNDFLFRPSDIVSLMGDDKIYFAQIKVLVENTFCEKYCAIIWLVPNRSAFVQNAPFNPELFIYGPQDENFYSMDAITFVMHAPTPYYRRLIPPTPGATNLTRPEKSKRRKCKGKRGNFRLPLSVVDLL